MLITKTCWLSNWWCQKWFIDCSSKCRQKSTLALKELINLYTSTGLRFILTSIYSSAAQRSYEILICTVLRLYVFILNATLLRLCVFILNSSLLRVYVFTLNCTLLRPYVLILSCTLLRLYVFILNCTPLRPYVFIINCKLLRPYIFILNCTLLRPYVFILTLRFCGLHFYFKLDACTVPRFLSCFISWFAYCLVSSV